MQVVITVTKAQATESAYVWTNSKNLHLDWDPEALYFDAKDNHHYGQMVNDSWSEAGNNCIIKWNGTQNAGEWRCGRSWMFPYTWSLAQPTMIRTGTDQTMASERASRRSRFGAAGWPSG